MRLLDPRWRFELLDGAYSWCEGGRLQTLWLCLACCLIGGWSDAELSGLRWRPTCPLLPPVRSLLTKPVASGGRSVQVMIHNIIESSSEVAVDVNRRGPVDDEMNNSDELNKSFDSFLSLCRSR